MQWYQEKSSIAHSGQLSGAGLVESLSKVTSKHIPLALSIRFSVKALKSKLYLTGSPHQSVVNKLLSFLLVAVVT